jgi:hypothetical protein
MVKFRAQKGFLRGNIDYREDDITLTCSQGVKKNYIPYTYRTPTVRERALVTSAIASN